MSSPRLLVGVVAAAVASAALPATASATLKRISPYPTPDASAQYGTANPLYTDQDGNLQPSWTQDGILAPGESVNVNFPLVDDTSDNTAPYDGTARGQLFETGSSFLSFSDPSGGSSPTLRYWTPSSGTFTNSAPYRIAVSSALQCGANVPLRLSFPTLSQDITYGLPTGAPGAYHTTQSYDIGNIVGDGGTKDSKVTVADTGLLKGLRIHIDSLVHQYSTHWLQIKLVGPDGTSVRLFDKAGAVATGVDPANKSLTNVTFSETPVNGQNPVDASVAAQSDFKNTVIAPVDSFSVFDGKKLDGVWHLVVNDVKVANDDRANHTTRGRALSGNDQMFQLGAWQIQDAAATCDTTPQAWINDPQIVDPAGGTIDASGSYTPVPGRKITSYSLDLGSGTYTTQSSPIFTVPAHAVGKQDVKLKVTDNTGATSAVLTRSVTYTKKPVFDANITPAPTAGNLISVSPATPKAGDTVTLIAHATDAETPASGLKYAWDLNDDGVFTDGQDTTGTATYTWTTSGPHIVRVLVTDGDGATTLYYQTVTIANLPPVAKFTYAPTVAIVGQPVNFDGTGSTDSDGTIAEWDYDLDQSGMFQSKTLDGKISYTFSQAGDYLVRMRAVDNTGGTDDASAMVHVTGAPVGVITASPSSPQTGETVSFSAAGSHDSDPSGSIAKYEWDLDGNGSWDVVGPTATTASRAYPNAGNVVVKLRVTDNDGAQTTTTLTLVVRNPSLSGGGGQTGGGVTPTPTPTPKPGTGGNTGTGGLIDSKTTTTLFPNLTGGENQSGTATIKDAIGGTTPSAVGSTPNGFVASIATGAKQHGSKTYKKGIAVNFKANTAGSITVNLMVLPKYAKTVGLKLKGTKLVKIGAGKVIAKKAGTYKFQVVVAKKYQRYVKKAKKLPVELRAVATSKDTGETLAIGKKFTYVK